MYHIPTLVCEVQSLNTGNLAYFETDKVVPHNQEYVENLNLIIQRQQKSEFKIKDEIEGYLNENLSHGPDPKLKTRNVIHNLTSFTNVSNLEQLRGYPFSSEYRKNPKNGKMIVVYKCDFDGCGKEFLRTWNLLDHIRMHFGERPFSCQYCRKTFTQRGNLRKHLQQHFAPTLDQRKKYRCSHCPSSFTERYNFRAHLLKKHGIEQ